MPFHQYHIFSSPFYVEYHIRELLTPNPLLRTGQWPSPTVLCTLLVLTWCCGQSLVCPWAGLPSLAMQPQHGRDQQRTYLPFTSSNLLQDYPECRFILCAVTAIAYLLLDANGFLLRRGFVLYTSWVCYLRIF